MRLDHFNSSTIEIIERMFEVIFNDLSSGMSEKEAGWRAPNQLGIMQTVQSGLLSSEIIERNSKGEVRLNFKNYRTHQELKRFTLQNDQLEYFLKAKTDEIKVNKAQETLNQIIEIVQQSPSSWRYIVALGWWKMLESSGMPALIDDILNEGFSPEDWTIKAVKSSSELALGASQKLGEINEFNDAINFLRQIKIPIDDITLPSPVDQDDVQRVKKILKWAEIEKELTEPLIKTLGFLWFSFSVLDSANLFPLSNESIIKLYKVIWDALAMLLGKSKSELLNELESAMSIFDSNQITWASDIIRIPEVV